MQWQLYYCGVLNLMCCLILIQFVNAQFNLFLNETEILRITGIAGVVYYIRNNTLQDKWLRQRLLIPTHVDNVSFTWFNKISPQPMFYKAIVSTSIKNIIQEPKLNINNWGNVPQDPTGLKIWLKCLYNGVVNVNLELDMFSSVNLTYLIALIRLQKICHNLDDLKAQDKFQLFTMNNSILIENWNSIDHSRKMFYIGVVFSCLIFLIFFLVLLVCYLRTIKSGQLMSCSNNCSNLYESSSILDLDDSLNLSIKNSIQPLQNEFEKYDLRAKKTLELLVVGPMLSADKITLSNKVEEGIYGIVYNGIFTENINENQFVIIKLFKDPMHLLYHEKRFKVCLQFSGLRHTNITQLIGHLMSSNELPMFVYPKFEGENLKKYLQSRNPDKCVVLPSKLFGSPQMASISSQICLALIYLHNHNIVHNDVAARNCMISEDMVVKLTDGLLGEDLFPSDYDGFNLHPVRWHAPEIIRNNWYSKEGDIWSFGVTMWEIGCYGDQPYAGVEVDELLDFLLAGYRLSQPLRCSNEMFSIMACCWSLDSEGRSSLGDLCLFLQQFYTNLKQYV